jgi:hypothetical protein
MVGTTESWMPAHRFQNDRKKASSPSWTSQTAARAIDPARRGQKTGFSVTIHRQAATGSLATVCGPDAFREDEGML